LLLSATVSASLRGAGAERRTAGVPGTDVMHHTGHHAWLRLAPVKITSWDFRKKVSFESDAFDFG
jgi:hypothetical protein